MAQNSNSKNILMKLEKTIVKKLYQSNHVILTYQPMRVMSYHILLFLEFIQIMFYVFYQVPFLNEFINNNGSIANNLSQQQDPNYSNEISGTMAEVVAVPLGIVQGKVTTFQYYQTFQFINFHLYTFGLDSINGFIILYFLLLAVFFIVLFLLFAMSEDLFQSSKNENIKEGSKFLIQIMALLMLCFVSILQIPFTGCLLQGYLCDEDPNEAYSIAGITCGSTTHTVLVIVSSLGLTSYLVFLYMQLKLFTSSDLDSDIPWGQFERNLQQLKAIYRLILVSEFIFDKAGNFNQYMQIVCGVITLFIVYKRYVDGLYFNNRIQRAEVTYQLIISIWLLSVGALQIANVALSATLISSIATNCFILTGIVLYRIERRKNVLLMIPTAKKITSPLRLETYFFRIYELIQHNERQDHFKLEGIFTNHMEQCSEENCDCTQVAEIQCDLKKFKNSKLQKTITNTRSDFSADGQQQVGIPTQQTEFQGIKSDHNLRSVFQVEGDSQSIQAMNVDLPNPKMLQRKMNTNQQKTFIEFKQEGENIKKEDYQVANDNNLFQSEDIDERRPFQAEKTQKINFRFLNVLIHQAILRFPKNIELRLFNSFLQKSRLNNQFKAIFELINCESCSPQMQEKFVIFRRKIDIQQALITTHIKNIKNAGYLDVINMFAYEKASQKFQLNEYLAVHAALGFWRELLQKHFKSSILQAKGMEISRCYQNIQDSATEMRKIYPDDIKFLFKYGVFLINIVNNEYDAFECFKRAQNAYESRLSKKNIAALNEISTFGFNSGAAIIIISASSFNYGKIIHINEEIEPLLGYQRKDLIDQNVSVITPSIIRQNHNFFIQRYLDSGRNYITEQQRQQFAITKTGYLVEIELLIKVYPHITGEILFVGFLQRSESYNGIEQPKASMKNLEQHYLITDDRGYIANLSEGLCMEIGLNSKFFAYTDYSMHSMINFQQICPEIQDPYVLAALEQEGGGLVSIDTRSILNNVELEKLSSDEILEIRSSIGKYQAFVQLKQIELQNPISSALYIYRVILISRNQNDDAIGLGQIRETIPSQDINNFQQDLEQEQHDENALAQQFLQSMDSGGYGQASQISSASAMSSGSKASAAFDSVIQNFKQSLGERKTPNNLQILNKLIIAILLAMIALSSLDFNYLQVEATNLTQWNWVNLYSELRYLYIVLIGTSMRTYIDVTNWIEFDLYPLDALDVFEDKTENGERSIVMEHVLLQNFEEFLAQQRLNGNGGNYALQQQFEKQPVEIIELDGNNQLSFYNESFQEALLNYIASVIYINSTEKPDVQLPVKLLLTEPFENVTTVFANPGEIDEIEKGAYYLYANGMRSLRTRSLEALQFLQANQDVESQQRPILIIMVVGILLTVFSIIALLFQIWQIEKIQGDILSLYAHLQINHISQVYVRCSKYIFSLNDGSILNQIQDNQDLKNEVNQYGSTYGVSGDMSKRGVSTIFKSSNARRDSMISEEEKEEEYFQNQIVIKKQRKAKIVKQGRTLSNQARQLTQNMYTQMIKRTFKVMKEAKQDQSQNMSRIDNNLKISRSLPVVQDANPSISRSKSRDVSKKSQKVQFEKKFGFKNIKEGSKNVQKEEETKSQDQTMSQHSSESMEQPVKKKKKKAGKIEELVPSNEQSSDGQSVENLNTRQMQFARTLKTQNLTRRVACIVVGVVLCTYFVQAYFFQSYFANQLLSFQQGVPILLNRYRYIMLAFGFMKERIVFNNSLASFETDPSYGHNLDILNFDNLLQNEQLILDLYISHSAIMNDLVGYWQTQDSSGFCSVVLQPIMTVQEIQRNSVMDTPGLTLINAKNYNSYLNSVIAACKAAYFGDLQTLQQLYEQGVDLNEPDWDYRAPLQYAVRGNFTNIVQYLISVEADVNTADRWGDTPLNFAIQNDDIVNLLVLKGGILGNVLNVTLQQIPLGPLTMNLTDQEYRLFYAAKYNDVPSLQIYKELGWHLNAKDIDGRISLHVAAAEGHQEAVQYLLRFGAQAVTQTIDYHGMFPVDNAQYFGHYSVHFFMDLCTTSDYIKAECPTFAGGILTQGVAHAVGVWAKYFTDVQLNITAHLGHFDELLEIVEGPQWQPALQEHDEVNLYPFSQFENYDAFQEVYFWRVQTAVNTLLETTLTNYTNQYSSQIQIIFTVFILLQIATLFILRGRMLTQMKDDIFESRGILNLIPNHIIEQNKGAVENIIKKLKN